jgi:CHAD domain-containing protein
MHERCANSPARSDPARDWDVFAGQTLAPVLEQFPGHAGLAALERASARLRKDANRSTRRLFASRRYQRILLGLGGLLQGDCLDATAAAADAREHAADALDRYHRRVLKRGKKIESRSCAACTGCASRRRSCATRQDSFSPLYPRGRSEPMLKALNDLQDVLGAINDCASAPS